MKISWLKVGGRTIKTVVAVFLCLLTGIIRKSDTAFYAAIAAVLCVQRTSKDSFREAFNREVATVIGGIWGIQMDGTDGIETARKLRERDEDIILIFITGIREYVFKAFDVAAFHYLLKPIEVDKFHEVFQRAKRELEKRKKQRRETIFIKTRNRSFTLEKDSILYIESRSKKVEIHTTGEIIEVYAAMNEMEGQLGESFYRCHRGYLVNMAYDESIERLQKQLLETECGGRLKNRQIDDMSEYISALNDIMALRADNEILYRELLDNIVVYSDNVLIVWIKAIPAGFRLKFCDNQEHRYYVLKGLI